MLDDLQRKLEIGSHSERLRSVRELGCLQTREAYGLLQVAAGDIDPQIQEEARRLMRESCWDAGGGGGGGAARRTPAAADEAEGQESLF